MRIHLSTSCEIFKNTMCFTNSIFRAAKKAENEKDPNEVKEKNSSQFRRVFNFGVHTAKRC